MAIYDTTLTNKLKFCNVYGFSREYGTKKTNAQNGGSLTTMEFNENQALAYDNERPILITEDSETNSIEYNANFALTNEGIKLTLGNGGFVGVEVKVLIIKNSSVKYLSKIGDVVLDNLKAGRVVKYLWTGDYWFCSSAPAIDSYYEQYPGMEEPAYICGGQWKNISGHYAGLTMRVEGGLAEEFERQLSVTGSGTSYTFPNNHGVTIGSLLVDNSNPDADKWEQRAVTAVSGNTVTIESAFSKNLTTVLILQNSGLPNITGAFPCYWSSSHPAFTANNSFYFFSGSNGYISRALETSTDNIGFNASRNNKIFGASTEVQMPNATVKLWKRVS